MQNSRNSMLLIYCCDPLNQRQVDPAFTAEVDAAERLQIPSMLIDFEALTNEGDPNEAVRRILRQPGLRQAVYRGWMLRPNQYQALYDALLNRGVRLVNTPTEYRHCHYLPDSYSKIDRSTPRTIWMSCSDPPSIDEVMDKLQVFGSGPVILKDFVKSRKHEWDEACFIPSASNRDAVERVVRRFLELQEDDLNEGLVFREFVEFEPLAVHERSGMPLTKEFRLFYFNHELIFSSEYWDQGDYRGLAPPVSQFAETARSIESSFFSMDVAKQKSGDWMIIELGDGQVAGLPGNADINGFYQGIAARWQQAP